MEIESDRNKHFGNGLSTIFARNRFRRDFMGQYYFDRAMLHAYVRLETHESESIVQDFIRQNDHSRKRSFLVTFPF